MIAKSSVSSAQIGFASPGNATLGTTTTGKSSQLGKSSLPVCSPKNYATCNTAASSTYIFTGNGNWTIPSNWNNNEIPPYILPNGYEILINPTGTCECVLNVPQTIEQGAKITVLPGKKLKVVGEVIIQ